MSADLVGIQLTTRVDQSRLQIEFSTPVEFSLAKDSEEALLTVLVWPIQSVRNAESIVVFPLDKFLKHVEYELIGSTLQLRIFLKTPNVRVNSKRSDWPFRLTLDISSSTDRPAVVKNRVAAPPRTSKSKNSGAARLAQKRKTPKPAPVQPRKATSDQEVKSAKAVDDTTKSDVETAEEVAAASTQTLPTGAESPMEIATGDNSPDLSVALLDSPRFAQEIFKFDLSTESTESDSVESTAEILPSNQKQAFIKLFIAFVCLDIILGGLYLLLKRHRRQSSTKTASRVNNQEVTVVHNNAAFVNLLHQTLKNRTRAEAEAESTETQSQELRVAKTALKIDSMIETLSTAMKAVPNAELEVDAFVSELNSLSVSTGMTVDQLIGKNGQEFVKNLKKLQKN